MMVCAFFAFPPGFEVRKEVIAGVYSVKPYRVSIGLTFHAYANERGGRTAP